MLNKRRKESPLNKFNNKRYKNTKPPTETSLDTAPNVGQTTERYQYYSIHPRNTPLMQIHKKY
jgi:hypothetical protein